MTSLIADSFFNDQEVVSAKDKLISKLIEHQSKITEIKPPLAEFELSYKETIDQFSQARGMNLYFPYLSSGIGNGPFVELGDGSIKYDFINGIGVHFFGHSHPKLVEATLDAALSDTIMQGNLQQTKDSFDFCKQLINAANKNTHCIDHCFLSSTGVMAGENALKMAFQKNYPAYRVLAFENCFAGRTITFSQITDKPHYREGLPHSLNVDFVPFFDYKNPEESIKKSIASLKSHIKRHPGKHAAMHFELIQGEGGSWPASKEFHQSLMQVCRENNIAVLVDEVQTFARTSELFAFQHYQLDDLVDIVWVGKASQVCATLFNSRFKPKPGLISQTFTSSSTAISGGTALIKMLTEGNFFGPKGKIEILHNHFKSHLEKIAKKYPEKIEGPFGIGGMVAFTPFNGNSEKANILVKELFKSGVVSFIAGANPARVRFLLPAGCLETYHIDHACVIIEDTLKSLE